MGQQKKRGKPTTFARTKPLLVHSSIEARFDFPLPSWMIDTSALIDPLVVKR
jgi:hypothetical protein